MLKVTPIEKRVVTVRPRAVRHFEVYEPSKSRLPLVIEIDLPDTGNCQEEVVSGDARADGSSDVAREFRIPN